MGDYTTAYDWRVKYDEYRYTRLNETISAEYARKEGLFEDQKKQEKIEDQKRELRVREAELASVRTQQLALLGGAAALVLLVALLFIQNRLRARANSELAAKNEAIQRERNVWYLLLKKHPAGKNSRTNCTTPSNPVPL